MAESRTSRELDADRTSPSAGDRTPGELTAEDRVRLVRLAYRFLWNREDAEDAVQDALLAAQQRAGQLVAAGKWWSWLCRIVVQRCRLVGRRKGADARLLNGKAQFSPIVAAAHDLTAGEAGEVLRELIPLLPRRQREVLVLRHLQGMSFEQIGEVLEISEATARVQAMNARETLLRLMMERRPGFAEGRMQAESRAHRLNPPRSSEP